MNILEGPGTTLVMNINALNGLKCTVNHSQKFEELVFGHEGLAQVTHVDSNPPTIGCESIMLSLHHNTPLWLFWAP